MINAMGCLVFAAFGIEAFPNHAGEQLFSEWDTYLKKSLSPEAKLFPIGERIKLKIDFGAQPCHAFKTLFRFRNAMAHSVTEDLGDQNAKHYHLELGNQSWPAAEWEALLTSRNAEKISKDILAIVNRIVKKAKIKPIPRELFSEFMEILSRILHYE